MTKNAGLDTIVMPGGYPDRTKTKGRDRTQENEPDAKRRAFMLAVLPTLARRDNTGQRIHCKGGEQTEICFQMCDCGRGYYGGLPAIRAHKIAHAPHTRGTIPKGVRLSTTIIN